MDWQKIKKDIRREENYQSLYKNEYEKMLYWLMFGFAVMLSCICGMCRKGEDLGFASYYTYTILAGIMYAMRFTTAYSITENNKKANVFKKLMYVPVNLKDLVKTKAMLIIKQASRPTIILQAIALFVNLLYNGGKVVFTLQLFWPLITGIIMVAIHIFQVYLNCKKAMEQ